MFSPPKATAAAIAGMRPLDDFTGLAWIAAHPWLYPALEVVHIVGIGLLLGSLVLVELRMLGLAPLLPLAPLARFGLKLTLVGFAIAACSGSLMFLSQPGELLASPPFLLKMGLLLAVGANALAFHWRDGLGRADLFARLQTLASLGIWLAVIICGRWIAYY